MAHFYPWYPAHWRTQPAPGSPQYRYLPALGEYDSADTGVIDWQIDCMKIGLIAAADVSWWGQGSTEDGRMATLLQRAALKDFKFCVLNEAPNVQDGSISLTALKNQIKYLRDNYFSSPAYLKINNKPVVYFYLTTAPTSFLDKLASVRSTYGLYTVVRVCPDWQANYTKADCWYDYSPHVANEDGYYLKAVVAPNGVVMTHSITAGFWRWDEPSPQLARDMTKFGEAIYAAGQYPAIFENFYWNENEEGSSIEPSPQYPGLILDPTYGTDYIQIMAANPPPA